ncbi:hypothetical protein D0Z07_5959 [Hyphodiscus hymeniophilus]|uniref:Uncharacterized protein n=1 Tax=Hyphodiscus hymeniophilus TaxID=353542 RepID=A0A9P6VH67_9HELO|nr:hypothetical protein D0Z07_5959 [Hyphodiscus hymeniophilus]
MAPRPRRPRSPRPLVLLPGQTKPIPHKYTPDQHSYLAFPPSPTSLRAVPRTPLKPPSRLHLRTLLPSPPPPSTYTNTAPSIPYPWVWRCHKCTAVYRLGVTRRCLHDGHVFCSVPPQPPTPVDSRDIMVDTAAEEDEFCHDSGSDGAASVERSRVRLVQRRRRKSRRERRRPVGCGSEFDYGGWEEYNEWRRYTRAWIYEKGVAPRRKDGRDGEARDDGDEGGETMKRGCWEDCEFPSRCHHLRVQKEIEMRQAQALLESEQAVLAEKQMEAASRFSEDGGGQVTFDYHGRVLSIEDWEKELQRQKMVEFERSELEIEHLEDFAVAVYGNSVSSSSTRSASSSVTTSSQSSVPATEEMDMVGMERRGLEGEAHMVDVGLGPICPSTSSENTELGDEEMYDSDFATKHRKKSIQKIAQLTGLMLGVEPVERGYGEEKPRSPLKEGLTFGDQIWDDVDLGLGEVGYEESEIVEEERSGGDFRRRIERDEEEEFGDEEVL